MTAVRGFLNWVEGQKVELAATTPGMSEQYCVWRASSSVAAKVATIPHRLYR
jgi:hypothetical protein